MRLAVFQKRLERLPATVTAERIYLRPPAGRDWRAWSELRKESREFLAPWEPTWSGGALNRSSYRRRVDQQDADRRADRAYAFLIFRRDDDALLGGINLSNVRRGVAQTASFGYWIGAPHARQGYMSEALPALCDFGFQRLGLHRVEAACLPHNTASRRLLEKSGFRYEGYARSYLKIDGAWRDHLLYARLKDDPPFETREG